MTSYKYSPLIVGIGGTTNPGSQTEQALKVALEAAKRHGASTKLFGSSSLEPLPHYMTVQSKTSEGGKQLVESVRKADGLILASPGYHGSISGLVKNAIDYFEEMSKDERVYLDGLPVGLIVTAYGWQATGSTLAALRSIVHALRGWPTPLGVALNVSGRLFDAGKCQDLGASNQLEILGKQVADFACRNKDLISQKKVEFQEAAL
jgi:FMN reductase